MGVRVGRDWTGELRAAGLPVIAEKLGLEMRRAGSLSPCPACGAEQRGRGDRRGPVGMRRDRLGWRCHRCDAHGDAVTLVSLVAVGEAAPRDRHAWARVGRWAVAHGLLEAAGSVLEHPRALEKPRAPQRPPRAEVEALWECAGAAGKDAAAVRWLRARGIPVRGVDQGALARVLRRNAGVPAWARFSGQPWSVTHRLVVPLYGPSGTMESIHGRSLALIAPGGRGKGASPSAGCEVTGLVMANVAARMLLEGNPPSRDLVIVEGVPDFLAAAAAADAGMVFGIISGSWTAEVAARVPDGTRVELRTHEDAAGDRYAATIATSLQERCGVVRRSG